jgi:glycosyltransferase involved in cell wall biosynthesis
MNVLLTATTFRREYGGPAVSVPRLAIALGEAGTRIGLWAPDGSIPEAILSEHRNHRVTQLIGSLDDALAQFGRPDIIHDNGIWQLVHHTIAVRARQHRIKRLVSVRGMLEPWALNQKRIKKALAWQLYQRKDLERAAALHATAECEIMAIRHVNLKNLAITIPNGCDLPDSSTTNNGYRPASGIRQALFLSRIHPKKGLPMLIAAWARLRPPNWKLRIAGPDENGHRAEIATLIEQHGLADAISFIGSVHGRAKTDEYRAAELFILPTHSENFGMVIAEALSFGLPVLTTRSAPWPELETEKCGFWTEPNERGILDALTRATSLTRQALAEMGARGRELIKTRYSWSQIAERFVVAYEKLIVTGHAE